MHFRESNFQKFSGGPCPRTPLEARAFGPLVYRAARLLYHENPPTSKINETPGFITMTTRIPGLQLIKANCSLGSENLDDDRLTLSQLLNNNYGS